MHMNRPLHLAQGTDCAMQKPPLAFARTAIVILLRCKIPTPLTLKNGGDLKKCKLHFRGGG